MRAGRAFLVDDAFEGVDPFFGFLRIGIGRIRQCIRQIGHVCLHV
jgi:hypothetical protein